MDLIVYLLAFGGLLGVPILIGVYAAVRHGLDVEPAPAHVHVVTPIVTDLDREDRLVLASAA